MKQKIFSFIILLLLIVSISTCKKDSKKDSTNNSVGSCEDIDCGSNAYCDNGDCYRATMYITKIQVTKFPGRDSLGSEWDSAGKPDIYIQISSTGTASYDTAHSFEWRSSVYFPDADSNLVYDFIPSSSIVLDYVGSYTTGGGSGTRYYFELYDRDDPLPDTLMEEVSITTSTYGYLPRYNLVDTLSSGRFEIILFGSILFVKR